MDRRGFLSKSAYGQEKQLPWPEEDVAAIAEMRSLKYSFINKNFNRPRIAEFPTRDTGEPYLWG